MKLLLRHKLVVAGVLLVVAASAGGAYAATQSGGNSQQAFLNDVAKRLNVSPARLRSAFQQALIDRLGAAVKAGKITQAQANKLEQRLERSGKLPFSFRFGLHRARILAGGTLPTAASYLGLSSSKLISDLRSGESLAQIAKAHGKSVSGLEQAIVNAEEARLSRAVSTGTITKAQEQKMLSRLSARVDRLVTKSGFAPLRMGQRPGAVLPGGAAAAPPAFAPENGPANGPPPPGAYGPPPPNA